MHSTRGGGAEVPEPQLSSAPAPFFHLRPKCAIPLQSGVQLEMLQALWLEQQSFMLLLVAHALRAGRSPLRAAQTQGTFTEHAPDGKHCTSPGGLGFFLVLWELR